MDRRRAAGALLALAVCITTTAAAPTVSNHTALDLYDAATEGCYYNFQHYGEGDRIMTNEPCLNCTCHNRMLMCYLRVCPFTKPIGQDCTVEKRADQCCPIVTCPDVPVDLLTSTSTSSPAEYGASGVGKLDKYGCSINGKYFSEGSKVPPTPNKPCEHCYCIRNMTTCVMQECTLHVDGCTPIYHKDVCCPVRYSCDHLEDEILGLDDMSTTVRPTPGFLLTTTTESPVTQVTQDCVHNDQVFADGTSIKTEKACEHCYCMKGDIVCVVQECGTPMENEGKNCTSQPPREGQCCPDTYICEGDELTTELPSNLSTQPLLEELTTLSPPKRTEDEGSGYRNEPDEPGHSEIPVAEPDEEGSGDDLITMQPLDVSEKYTPGLIDETFASTEDQGLDTTKSPVKDEKVTIEPDNELNTVPSGVSEPSVPKLTTLTEEMKSSDEQEKDTTFYEYSTTPFDSLRTTKENILHTTESSFRKEDELHPPTDISTLEPIPTTTIHEEKEEIKPTIEDDNKITKPPLTDDTVTVTTTELSTSSIGDLSEPVDEPSQSSEHTVSEIQTTTIIPERTESTTVNAYENEIEDNSTPQETGRIPGEGDCLQAGITYRNNSSVPSTNNCQTDCKCISSIIKCDPIICSPPPEYMSNCVPTYDSSESCCPTYVCDGSKETLPPQPHSQMSETETSTLTPAMDCHDSQCDVQENKTSSAPVCTSEDCLTKPSEIPDLGDCATDNCKGVEQAAIQPDMQTDCDSTGCGGKTETTHHEPSSVPSVVPESCSDAECKQEVQITTCDGENCETGSTEGCQNEEDCKHIQHIPKDDTPCEGDSCKDISVDCGGTSCDVLPPIQQPTEICNDDDCKKLEEPALECIDDSCRRTDSADVEGKLPSDCTDSNCVQQKPEVPELSVSIPVSTIPEKTPELQNEVTLSPEITSDQESGIQTELPYEAGTKEPQSATDNFATESSTDISKITEPQTVEIQQSSELPTTAPHDITTEVSDTNVITSQPQDETLSVDKTTTIAEPPSVESHTHKHDIDKDISQISTTMASEDHEAESSTSTGVEDSVTNVPDILTPEPQEHTTHIQGEIITKKDEKLPEDTEQELTTQSTIREQTDLEKHTEQELVTKSPVFASETTTVILEKEPISTTPTSQFESEKTKLPEVPEILHITTESLAQHPLDTQSTSDAGENLSTEYPSVTEEKIEVTMDSADMTHASEVTSIVEETVTTITPEITHFSYEPQTTLSSEESGFTTPREVYTEKPDVHEPLVSTTDLLPTMKENEPTDISKEPEIEQQLTTIPPLISLEPELETEMPTSLTEIKDVPIKTTAPPSLDEDSKEKLPEEIEDKLSTEPQETYTEETSIPEEPSVTEHREFSPESSPEPELPDYIPVHPPATGEEGKPEQPDKEIPIDEGIPETTQSFEVATQEPFEVTETLVTDKDTGAPEFDKSDEFTQSSYSELPESHITEVHTEREPVTTSPRVEVPETATQSKPIDTEEEDILKTTKAPEAFVKDDEEKLMPTTAETTDVDTNEKQTSTDKIQTEPHVTITPAYLTTKLPLPELGQEEDLSPKTPKPETEMKGTVTDISDQTTEQYDHSQTLPDMIELVEHHPISDISTIPSITDETSAVSYEKPTTTYTDGHEVDEDKLVTLTPIVSETDHKLETESGETYYTTTPSVTSDIEKTYDGEISTKRPVIEVDHTITADEKLETGRPETPAFEQPSMPDKESITEKTDISEIEPEVMPTIESSTQNPETSGHEQEMTIKDKPLTEKPETAIVEEITQPQESITEKEMPAEPEYFSKEPGAFNTEQTTEPGKVLHIEPSKMPGMEAEKETTMKTPVSVTEFSDSSVEPETSTSSQEITPEPPKRDQEIVHATDSEPSVTEYLVPDQEIVTKSEVEEESVPGKASSTDKTSDIEQEVTPETEIGASASESPTTETYIIPSHEPDTYPTVPESIVIDSGSKTDMDLPASTQEPESTKTDQEIKPDKESSTTTSNTVNIEYETGEKPDEKISTIEPDITEIKHEGKPDKEPTNVSKVPLHEHKVTPDMELSTEQQEILDIDKEETPEIDVTPKEHLEMPTTELTQSQESVTGEPVPTLNELEAIPEKTTEKSEISDSHDGALEQDSKTKEPETSIVDHDVLSGQEPTTKEPASTEIGDVEIPHEQATERPPVTDTLYETHPDQETVTLKPEIPVTDYVTGQDFTTESEIPELVHATQPDKESSTGGSDTSEQETFTEQSVEPDIELQSSTKQPEIPGIEPHYSTERSEVPEIEQQPSTEQPELPGLEPEHFTEPSEIHDIKPQSSTEPLEISEVEAQSSTEQPEIPKIELHLSTERSEEPEIVPPSSTERLEVPEIEPQYSTESSELSTKQPEISEIEPQSTEPSQVPEIKPEFSTELTELPELEPHHSTESSEIPIKSYSSTEPSEISEVEPHSTTERGEIPEPELQSSSEPSAIPEIEPQSSTEQSEVPKIEPQASTELPQYDIISTETPESEIYEGPSTQKVESGQEMKPAVDATEPSVESETGDKLKPDQESATERLELPETEPEIEPSTERLVTPEIEYEFKPTEGSSTVQTEISELESEEPEPVVTKHDGVNIQTSTALPKTSEQEIKTDSDSSTDLPETPETTDRVISILPSESQTQSKPIEEDILIKTTTEIPSSVIYESSTTVDKELYEKSTEASVSTEKTTPSHTPSSSSPEAQEDSVKQDDLTTLPTTSRYPLKEEPTTAVMSEFDKTPTPEIEIPVQTERDTEKPTGFKDTTAPEEEFLAVTTKATTQKTEEVKPTESSAYDKFTKPHSKPESSSLLPSSTAEIPKPGFNEVQAIDEIPSPEDDGHFAPSATGGYGGQETDYEDENQPFGPGTCRYGGKVYVSAQQIPRDDPCDFCFCFRSDIICLQQSCPPPIHGCHEEPIQGFCCPRYECPVSMANTLNITTTTTTTTTTLPPHFNLNAYQGAAQRRGCQIKGHTYKVGEVVRASSGPCLHCTCGGDGQMKCDPKACTPEPMLRQMIAAAVSAKRRR